LRDFGLDREGVRFKDLCDFALTPLVLRRKSADTHLIVYAAGAQARGENEAFLEVPVLLGHLMAD
jgi:hypothetical protein